MASASTSLGLSPLECLPPELIAMVLLDLSNHEIKQLRLTSRTLEGKVLLRLHRVFISANPRNIEVFRAIADHEIFRHQVREIIWDDAQLLHDVELTNDQTADVERFLANWEKHFSSSSHGIPEWFVYGCYSSTLGFEWKPSERNAILSLKESWNYYLQLLEQQDSVLASGADAKAFRYGLTRFPLLKKITLTAAAHGLLHNPSYETPMIRSFPRGFIYPITRAWRPEIDPDEIPVGVPPWEQTKEKWRGFGIILCELAKKEHNIIEFIIETKELKTGINCRVFDKPCEEYNNLVTLLQQPGFKRLDLMLYADGQYFTQEPHRWTDYLQQGQPWCAFRSGLLKRALEKMEDPTHVSIGMQVYDDWWCYDYLEAHNSRWISLDSLIPVGKWQKIQHLGISGLIVDVDDLISVLAAQPRTLRSVELSDLIFTEDNWMGRQMGYARLLEGMRYTLQWRERVEEERPVVTIHIQYDCQVHFQCLDYYVNGYLYGIGENIFKDENMSLQHFTTDHWKQIIKGRRGSPDPSCYLRCVTNR